MCAEREAVGSWLAGASREWVVKERRHLVLDSAPLNFRQIFAALAVASALLLLFGMEHASIGAGTTHEARVALLEAQVAMLNAQKQRPAPALKAKAKPPPPPPPPSPWCWCFWPSEIDTRSRRQQPPDATSLDALHAACANAHSMTGRRPSREADDEEQQEVSRLTVVPEPQRSHHRHLLQLPIAWSAQCQSLNPPSTIIQMRHHQRDDVQRRRCITITISNPCRCSPASQSPPTPPSARYKWPVLVEKKPRTTRRGSDGPISPSVSRALAHKNPTATLHYPNAGGYISPSCRSYYGGNRGRSTKSTRRDRSAMMRRRWRASSGLFLSARTGPSRSAAYDALNERNYAEAMARELKALSATRSHDERRKAAFWTRGTTSRRRPSRSTTGASTRRTTTLKR